MKPIPSSNAADTPKPGESQPLGGALPGPGNAYSAANRRSSAAPAIYKAYPWLLCISTAIAGLFCVMYIKKPVSYQTGNSPNVTAGGDTGTSPSNKSNQSLLPDRNHLPGQDPSRPSDKPLQPANPKNIPSVPPLHSFYEETNMRVQHILTAEAPGGHVSRIDINVPVLYASRQLRWSTQELEQARSLMLRLMNYQDKTRELRAEGQTLLAEWSQLIEKSIPSSELRADSPSLPANQENATHGTRNAGMTSTNAIQIQANP